MFKAHKFTTEGKTRWAVGINGSTEAGDVVRYATQFPHNERNRVTRLAFGGSDGEGYRTRREANEAAAELEKFAELRDRVAATFGK